MEEKLAELYNKLANQIIDIIPAEWDNVYYLGEVEKKKLSSGSVFYFEDIENAIVLQCHKIPEVYQVSKNIYMDLFMKLDDTLLEIYDCFIENGQEAWEQLSLYFNETGEFKIEFFYDVMENSKGAFQREIAWAYQTFGYMPEEGSYEKQILEQYLKE